MCPKDLQNYNILNHGNEAIYLSLESCKVASTHHELGDPSQDCELDTLNVNNYIDGKIGVRTKYITQYFTIDNYMDDGTKLDYIGLQESFNLIWIEKAATLTYSVQQNTIDVYDSRFLDLSSMTFFNYGDRFVTYSVEGTPNYA